MSKTFEYFFDYSCPYAYLASTKVEGLAERTGAVLKPKPIVLGGVFRALAQPQHLAATLPAAKQKHMADDLRRFANAYDVPLNIPAGHPIRTITALRVTLAAGEPYMPLAHLFYKAYWVDNLDISEDSVLEEILNGAGYDATSLLEKAASQAMKEALHRRTDEALEVGVFGVPAFTVEDQLYWGQDRMAQVERALGVMDAETLQSQHGLQVDYWFDYSSPFAAIASARVDDVFGASVRYRPMLLGGVFRAIGTANVPLATFSEPKRRWARDDMFRQAEEAGFPLAFPTRFPMRTILPLRMTLLADPDSSAGRALVHAFFRAYWAEDKDIADPDVAAAIADSVGLDGASLVQGTQEQRVKDALIAATDEAVSTGVFGAPTFVVKDPDGADSLYWGVDRIDFAAQRALGNITAA